MRLYCVFHNILYIISVVCFLAFGSAQAAVLDSYQEDFDSFADGASINGKDYWVVSSGAANNAAAQSGVTAFGMGNSVKLTGAPAIPVIERVFLYGGLSPTWIRFKARPAVSAQTPSVPSGGIGAVCFDYTGKVLASDGASWVDAGKTYTIDQWYDVAMKLNFKDHTYDLYLVNTGALGAQFIPIKTNLRFINPTKNSLSGLKFYGSYLNSGLSNSYIDDVSVTYIERLEIITAPARLLQGQVSGPITVQLQDSTSSPQTAVSDITLELKSTSSQGRFSLELEPWVDVKQIILPKFSQSAGFYYKDNLVGKPVISVTEYPLQGFLGAYQEMEILSVASSFDVEAVSPQNAGQSFPIKLTAKDKNGNISESYNGSVNLSINYLSPTTGSFFIQPNIVSDFVKGVSQINAVYPDCGWVTIAAVDSEDSSLVGKSSEILFLPASFTVSAEGLQTASKPFALTINAKNAQGMITPNYNNSVNLYPVAVMPQDISKARFSPLKAEGSNFNNGIANVEMSYNFYGTIKIRAEDTVDAAKFGTSNEIKFFPKRITLNITPAPGERGFFYINEPIEIMVKVEDEMGNPIPNYTGTVELASSQGLILPGPYNFANEDEGKRIFSANSFQEGDYTVFARGQGELSAEPSKITVKNVLIQVMDNTFPVGTGEVTIQIVDDNGSVITSENNLGVYVQAFEEIGNNSVSMPSALTFKKGKIILPISDTEAETVSIVVSSAFKIKAQKATIIFGRAGKTGINQLMWRELKKKQ